MTIRFAAANPEYNLFVARRLGATRWLRAANDNTGDNKAGAGDDRLLKAALRHFAEHGLGAAEHARGLAEAAFFVGDSDRYRWWLAICRTLDKRLARAAASRIEGIVTPMVKSSAETLHKVLP